MKPFRMALPRTVEEAASAATSDDAHILAGGTDLLAEIKERLAEPDLVVNLKSVPGIDEIKLTSGGLEIGALATLTDVANDRRVLDGWPALAKTIERAATPHIRNVGTIGGNLCQRPRCWYYRDELYPCLKKGGSRCYAQDGENEFHAIFDNGMCAATHPSNTAPVLMAYDAHIDLVGPKGTRSMALEEFFTRVNQNIRAENVLQPGEVLVRIRVPRAAKGSSTGYVETREKQSFDWSVCGTTVRLDVADGRVKDARVVLSAVAHRPWRRPELEEMLRGKKVDDGLSRRVAAAAAEGATPLEHNKHKVALLKATTRRAIVEAWEGATR